MTDQEWLDLVRLRDGADGELLASARGDAPDPARREAAMERVITKVRERRRARRQSMLATGVGVLALAAGWLVWSRAEQPSPKLLAEPRTPPTILPPPAAPPPTASAAPDPLARCTPSVVALGGDPLIDDFEDGDTRVLLSEKRSAYWIVFNDGTSKQHPRPGSNFAADRIPGGRGTSRFGLHVRGGKFTDWGASLAAELAPRRCYDASVYAGLTFWARGRGSVRVAAKMTQIVAEEFGGTCLGKCFDAHLTRRTLSPTWQQHTVRWEELTQSGFGQSVPFDAASLYSIEFSMLPEQTPFDFWIDDVAFLPRDAVAAP
jgi:Carbohydrate binding domain (family 11)